VTIHLVGADAPLRLRPGRVDARCRTHARVSVSGQGLLSFIEVGHTYWGPLAVKVRNFAIVPVTGRVIIHQRGAKF
jgi:hypothetical protein